MKDFIARKGFGLYGRHVTWMNKAHVVGESSPRSRYRVTAHGLVIFPRQAGSNQFPPSLHYLLKMDDRTSARDFSIDFDQGNMTLSGGLKFLPTPLYRLIAVTSARI